MKRIYPNIIERRHGLGPDKKGANRIGDKVFSFVVFVLAVFLVNMVFGCNYAEAKTVYNKDAYGNIIQRIECDSQRCQYYDANGNYIGRKERSGSVIHVYDRNGSLVRTESAGGL